MSRLWLNFIPAKEMKTGLLDFWMVGVMGKHQSFFLSFHGSMAQKRLYGLWWLPGITAPGPD
jgi:hypothetical protein